MQGFHGTFHHLHAHFAQVNANRKSPAGTQTHANCVASYLARFLTDPLFVKLKFDLITFKAD